MRKQFHHAVMRFTLPLLILMLACSLSPTIPSSNNPNNPASPTDGTDYRFDELPIETSESAAFQEYQAIAKWDISEINYYFVNGTQQLPEIGRAHV